MWTWIQRGFELRLGFLLVDLGIFLGIVAVIALVFFGAVINDSVRSWLRRRKRK